MDGLNDELTSIVENISGRKLVLGSVLEELEITRTFFEQLIISDVEYWIFIYKDDTIKVLTKEFVFDLDNKLTAILMIDEMGLFVNIFESAPMNKDKDVEDEVNKVLDSLSRLDEFEKATKLKSVWAEYKKENRDGSKST